MAKYLLILRDEGDQFQQFDDQKRQEILQEFTAWNNVMRAKEQLLGAGKLTSSLGQTVRNRDDELCVDGPFSEAKEAISGYYCVQAEDDAAAAEVAKGCPILSYGGSIEVRELALIADV